MASAGHGAEGRDGARMKRTRLRPVSPKTRARWGLLHVRRALILARANGRCEVCGEHAGARLEAHHVVKRSHARDDSVDNLIALCRDCHRRTDGPYAKGRLMIRALGHEEFDWKIVLAPNKWEATT